MTLNDPSSPGGPPARLRILIVEDNPVDRMALRRHMQVRNLPYDVTEADSIEVARGHLVSTPFDALVLDHDLPDGTGFDLFKAAAGVPVVFVTGADDISLAIKALKAGAADYLIKDIERRYLELLPHTLTRAVQERATRTALRTAQAQMHDLLEFLPTAALAFDERGRITFSNRKMAELWGRTPGVGDQADQFIQLVRFLRPDGTPLDPAECWRKMFDQPGQSTCEVIIEPTPDQRHHLFAYGNPLHDECGLPKGAILVWVDVTEMRRLEAQVGRTRRLEAIGTLAGGMAHEFNNLLAAIMGNLQLAEMDLTEDHAARPSIGHAVQSCRRARDLVQRMLRFSRSTNDQESSCDLAPLIESAVQLLQLCLPKTVTLELSLAPCPCVLCIPDEFTQAILQLGINAGQALENRCGSVRISLRHGLPDDRLRERFPDIRADHTVRVTMEDTGVGMSPETLERIFDPFFTTRSPGRGMGLGLPEVYGTMKRIRGAIVVESNAGSGTRVHLYFPEAVPPTRPIQA